MQSHSNLEKFLECANEPVDLSHVKQISIKVIIIKFAKFGFDIIKWVYLFIQEKIIIILITIGAMMLINIDYLNNNKSLINNIISLKDKQIDQAVIINSNTEKFKNAKKFLLDTNSLSNFYKFLVFLSKSKPKDSHLESIDIDFDNNKANLVIHAKTMTSLSNYLNILNNGPKFFSVTNSNIFVVKPEYIEEAIDNAMSKNSNIVSESNIGNNVKFNKAKFNKMLKNIQIVPDTSNKIINNKVYAATVYFNF